MDASVIQQRFNTEESVAIVRIVHAIALTDDQGVVGLARNAKPLAAQHVWVVITLSMLFRYLKACP